jgi:hypothetical protein
MSPQTIALVSTLKEAKGLCPTAKVVHLSEDLRWNCYYIAHGISNKKRNTPNAHNREPKNDGKRLWVKDYLGTLGEQAVCKYLGIFYEPPGQGEPDIRGTICVRCRGKHWYDLQLRDDDSKHLHLPWVLVTHELGQSFALLHGWGYGHELKPLGEFTDHGNGEEKAWFVNRKHLRPMDTLTPDIWDQLPF